MEIFIYKIQNKINGMCYIGLTNDPTRRWNEHINAKTDSLIHKAIQKYGVKNFSFSILEKGIANYGLAAEREKYYIQLFNSYECGYNRSLGGETPQFNQKYNAPFYLTEAQKNYRNQLQQKQRMARKKTRAKRK